MRLIVLILIFIPFIATANESDISLARDQFSKGCEAYKAGEFESALGYFQQAETVSTGFAINYNLGNVYFKLNQIKESILYYERALKYEPSNEDVIYNLRLANDQIVDRIENLPKSNLNRWWRAFRYGMGPDGWGLIALMLAFFSGALFLLYTRKLKSHVRRIGFYGGLIGVILMVLSLSLAQSAKNFRVNDVSGIIFSDKVDVKGEPRAESTNILVLHAGTKVNILKEVEGWYEVEIASGDRGWLEISDIEEI